MPQINNSQLRNYGIPVLFVAVALALMLMLHPWVDMRNTPFLLFFSAVIVSAWYGGWKSGLLATFLSVLLSYYFFLPQHSSNFSLPNPVRMGLFVSQGILFSCLCEALRIAKRRAEVNLQKLKVSEERFQLALSSSDIVVFQQDRDLVYQWVHNPHGLVAEEMVGKSDYELFPDSEWQQLAEIKRNTLETGISNRKEVCLTVQEETCYYDLLVEPLKDVDNSILGIVCVALNITQRKQAEAAQKFLVETSTLLASSLDYQVTLCNVANLAVPTLADLCIVDILQADGSVENIAIAAADPIKKNILQELRRRYPPNTKQKHSLLPKLEHGESVFYREFADAKMAELAEDEEHLQLLRGLGIRSLMLIPLYSREQLFGAISFVTAESHRQYGATDLALAEDITQRAATAIDNARLYQETQEAKQAAERAVSRITRLQKITAALSEALTPQEVADVVVNQGIAALGATSGSVVLLTGGGNTLKVVQAIGYPQSVVDAWVSFPLSAEVPIAETVRTRQSIFLASPAALISKYPALENALDSTNNQAFASIPLIVEGKAIGALGLSFTTAHEFSQEDRGFMLTLAQQCGQAIARAQLYEAEKIARSEAETANRIKDEFLAVLSHEIRTPLSPILGWSKLLRTRKLDEATIIRALETIERNATLQTQLIEDLLDVSRILQGKLSLNIYAVDLSLTITAALETVRLAAEAKSIQLQIVLAEHIGLVRGDSNRLQQVVWNLLSNAVKFTPTGGRVEVYLSRIEDEAQIRVIDTGKGISPEFLPHVFDYFRQADGTTTRAFGGLGLGLAIVRHLVELHGGTISAESPGEGQGATFTCRFPLLRNTQLQTESVASAHSKLTNQDTLLSGINILLVDDQADMRDFFGMALSKYGAVVKMVESASEALEAIAQSQPDIIVSDIGMPIIDGYMLLREVRKWPKAQGGEIPAIALTAYAGEIDHQRAIAAGYQKHIPKPADPIELARAIAHLLKLN